MAKATRVQWQDPTGNAAMRQERARARENRAATAPRKPWQAAGEVLGMQPAAVQAEQQMRRTGREYPSGRQYHTR